MEEPETILRRLERIEALGRRDAPAAELLGELRALVGEAEAWSRREGGAAGARAVDGLRRALDLRDNP